MKIIKCDYCEKEMGNYYESSHSMIFHTEPNEVCEECSAQLELFKELRKKGGLINLTPTN